MAIPRSLFALLLSVSCAASLAAEKGALVPADTYSATDLLFEQAISLRNTPGVLLEDSQGCLWRTTEKLPGKVALLPLADDHGQPLCRETAKPKKMQPVKLPAARPALCGKGCIPD